MAFLKVKNRAVSTLASGISDSDLSLTVATGEGALFPSTYPFHITIEDEILECTNRSTDVLTVTREAEGTTAAAHASGKAVELRITAAIITELQALSLILWKDASEQALDDNSRTTTLDWTDLDLTAYTSSNAKFAIIQLVFVASNTGSAGQSTLAIRKNGTTPTYYPKIVIPSTEPNWKQMYSMLFVGLDSGEVIEYTIQVATGATVSSEINILGYIE